MLQINPLVLNMKSSQSSLLFAVFITNALGVTVLSQTDSSILIGKSPHRIVGGYTISIKDAPWTVQIIYDDQPICGGSIVSISKILSAAHCTFKRNRQRYSVRAGTSKYNRLGQVQRVSKILDHPQYSDSSLANDISILFLKKNLKLSPSVAVIGIDRFDLRLPDGIDVLATGWGRICESYNCPTSKMLRAVKLPIIGNSRCRKLFKEYEQKFTILSSMLCAGYENGGKDTCQGDSGGPIVYNNTLIGIVSFGIGCSRPKLPGVYTRVFSFNEWIRKYL